MARPVLYGASGGSTRPAEQASRSRLLASSPSGDDWAAGFVLEMADGRRLHAESYADGPDWGSDSCVSVVSVPADSVLPKLPQRHSSELYGWVEDLPELGEYLRRLGQRERALQESQT